jgi:hypothetical protein
MELRVSLNYVALSCQNTFYLKSAWVLESAFNVFDHLVTDAGMAPRFDK